MRSFKFASLVVTVLFIAVSLLAEELAQVASENPSIYVMLPHLVGLPAALTETLQAASAQAAQDEGLQVMTQSDAQDILANAADLQDLGADASGVELAALCRAVGAKHLLAMTASKLGEDTILHVRLIDAKSSKVLSRREVKVSEFDGDLNQAVKTGVRMTLALIFAHLQGQLELIVNEEGANILVDGVQVGVSPLKTAKVTGGFHLLQVNKAGFIRVRKTFEIKGNDVVRQEIKLRPSKEFMAQYRGSNTLLRRLAWVTTGTALVLGSGAAVLGYFKVQQDATSQAIVDEYEALSPPEQLAQQIDFDQRRSDSISAANNLGYSAVGVGIVAGLSGLGAVTFWIVGEDPDRYAEFE